jgi:hypothetical protein
MNTDERYQSLNSDRSEQQQRQFFRVKYPSQFRPTLFHDDECYEVLDVSEYGLKFSANDECHFMHGQKLQMELQFHDKDKYNCMGRVVRLQDSAIAVNLVTPLPLPKIRSQHIFLIGQSVERR